jgi:hypothetical protein
MNRTSFYRRYFQKVVWDYDVEKLNLDRDENIFRWFLERKINYDGLKGIREQDLLDHYRGLKIDPAYKILIEDCLIK